MVIGPALLRVAGDWNWWPWGLAKTGKAPMLAHHD
jgi:RND superfamily putative drug exporter